jgi:Tfp pilus assembly protein FimT
MRPLPPSDRFRRTFRHAFTLAEILGVLALIGLIGGLVAANFDELPSALRNPSPEDSARRAFSAARRHALDTHAPVTLRLSPGKITLTDADGEPTGTFPAPAEGSGKTLDLIADDGSRPQDATPLAYIHFTAEGSVSPVRVRLTSKAAARPRVWRADPLSAVLTEEREP